MRLVDIDGKEALTIVHGGARRVCEDIIDTLDYDFLTLWTNTC